jgi:hypothetical protein
MTNLKIHSNFWRIDNNDSEPMVSQIPTNISFSKDSDIIAVSSNHMDDNLKIYQLSSNSLIHIASITLPDIHSLKFLKPATEEPNEFKFLLSGHSNGIVHLSAIPLVANSVFEDAEIVKRFNHKKHIKSLYNSNNFGRKSLSLNNGNISTTITSIDLVGSNWDSAQLNSMVAVYDHHLFYWDTARSRKPVSIIRTNGISYATTNKKIDSLTAIVGDFGLSLIDLRTGKNKEKTSIYLPSSQSSFSSSKKSKGFKIAEWCNNNENYIATVQADENVVQLWDIRKLEPLTKLTSFTDSISSIKWYDDIIWTGDNDGYLTKWDIDNMSNLKNKQCIISKTNNSNNSSNNEMHKILNNYKFEKTSKHLSAIRLENIENGSTVKISDGKILSLEKCLLTNDIICLDGSYLSLHGVNKTDKPKNVKRSTFRSLNYPNSNSVKENKRITSYASNSSLESDASVPIFDHESFSSLRRSSDFSTADSPTKNATGDYLASFQKEIDNMINNLNTKTVNNTIYL